MSRGPNPNQAAELLQAAAMVRELDAEGSRLHSLILASQKQLETVRSSRRRNAENIVNLLTSMDCAANHNNGWESRIVELMAELTVQATKAAAGSAA